MKYLIKTTYPCLIKTETSSVFLDKNDSIDCENEDFFYVYPQNTNQIPFYVDLQKKQDCELYSFVKIKNQNVVLLEHTPPFVIEQKETLTFSGKPCVIFVGKNRLSFETETTKISCSVCHSVRDYQVFKLQNFACIKFKQDFYAFSIKQEKLFHFAGDALSFENGILSVTKKYHDINIREKTFNIKFENGITIENQLFSSEENKFSSLTCLSFLESVRAGDYACALNCLSTELKNRINQENLKEFFGNIIHILPLSLTEFILIAQKKKSYVSFEMTEGQISDITLDDL